MEPFKQSISVWQGVALYVGAVIGSGILILPGITAGIAGANALFSWIGMVLFSIPLACTFAFLAREYPSAGGVSTFVEKAYGTYSGAIIGWFYFIAASVGQFIVPLTGGMYVVYALHLPKAIAFIIAGIILMGAIIGNYFGLKTSGKVQIATSGLTLFILLSTILFAIPLIKLDYIKPHLSYETIAPIGTAGMLIFWSFFGWEAIASLAPEFKNPKKDIVKATWGAIIIVGVIYLGSVLAVIGTHSFSEGFDMDELMNSASLVQVMIKTTGVNGGYATAIVALVICLGTTNAFVASISRLCYSLSHDKLAPSWLDNINEKYSTPTRAIIFVGFFACVGLIVTYAYNIEMNKLVYIPNSLGIATYILGSSAGAKLLKSKVEKLMSMLTCVVCLIAYLFIGTFIQIPIVVGITCVLYVNWRSNKERKVKERRKTV